VTIGKISACSEYHKISFLQAIKENVEKNPKYLCQNMGGQLQVLSDYLKSLNIFFEVCDPKNNTLDKIIDMIIKGSMYVAELANSKNPYDIERYENVLTIQQEVQSYVNKQKFLGEKATIEHFLQQIDAMLFQDDAADINAITLSTIHGVKGREFEHVYIISFHDQSIPSVMSRTPAEIEEERRLAYVALTRAKTQATISYTQMYSNIFSGKSIPATQSRFLCEIPSKCLKII